MNDDTPMVADARQDAAARFWQQMAQGRFMLQYDPVAGKFQCYPRPVSLHTVAGSLEWREVSGEGVLLARTVLRVPTPGYQAKPPYAVGIVKLAEGPRIFGALDPSAMEHARIGSRMQVLASNEPREGGFVIRLAAAAGGT